MSEIVGTEPMAYGNSPLKAAITPLRLVFCGGLLLVFDLQISQTVNGEGFKFDFLNDTVGAILIAVGVFRLAAIPIHLLYSQVMTFVKIVSVLAIVETAWAHVITKGVPEWLSIGLSLLGFAEMVAIVCFCVAMRWACDRYGFLRPARSWRVTTILFVLIYLIPLGLFYLVAAVAIAMNESFSFDLGPLGLLLLPVFAVPLIHLFVSTSRMKREAEAKAEDVPPPTLPAARDDLG